MSILSKAGLLLGAALILGFFSEFYFVNEGPVFDLLDSLKHNPAASVFRFGELILYYVLFAYPFLIALGNFRIGNWRGLLLAGALYGLAAEALVVPVVYEAPPYSFVWTSLSWHTLVDVMLGWWLLRLAMRSSPIWAVSVPALLGLFWGGWATWFWGDAPQTALSLGEFAAVASFTGVALMIGVWLADRAPASAFRAGWIEIAVVAAVSLAIFALTARPFAPFLPLAILALVALILLALRAEAGGPVAPSLRRLDTPPALHRYLVLLLIPATATASYAAVLATNVRIPSDLVVLPMVLLGTASVVLVLIGAGLTWRRHGRTNPGR